MKRFVLALFVALLFQFAYAQEAALEENKDIVETKIGANLNFHLGKKKNMMLSTMLRSVHNNSMKGETFLNFKGIEAEVYFQIPVMKYLGFFIDAEADVNKELDSYLCFSTGFNSTYNIGCFFVFGELKYSTCRNITYFNHDSNPHLKYKAGAGVNIVEDLCAFSSQVILPHDLSSNSIDNTEIWAKLDFKLSRSIGLMVAYAWTDEFGDSRNVHSPRVNLSYSF